MRLITFDIFTKKVDTYYNELVSRIDAKINGIKQNKMTAQEIQTLQFQIFNALYNFPKLGLGETKGNHSTEQLSFGVARELIQNGFRQSSNESSSTITEIEYKIEYTGGLDALQLTQNYNKRAVRGSLFPNSFNLQYHFQGIDVAANGPNIKLQKDNLLELLAKNNDEVLDFFEAKKDAFLSLIKLKIQTKLDDNQKRIDDSSYY